MCLLLPYFFHAPTARLPCAGSNGTIGAPDVYGSSSKSAPAGAKRASYRVPATAATMSQ